MAIAWAGCYVVFAAWLLNDYVRWDSLNFLLGLVGLLLMAESGRPQYQARFAWIAMAFFILCLLIPAKTFLFFGIISALVYTKESSYGRAGILSLLTLVLMSPLMQYVTGIFSFPIRMELTQWAGWALGMTGMETSVTGNVIYTNGNEYTVDPACVGLKMLLSSWIAGLIVIAVMQKAKSKVIATAWVWSLLAGILGLNIIANLFRILVLVYFDIPAGTVMHDIIGIVCMVIYVLVPSVTIVHYLIYKVGRVKPVSGTNTYHITARRGNWLHGGIVLTAIVSALTMMSKDKNPSSFANMPDIPGYSVSSSGPSVLKLENEGALIYVKKTGGFYYTEHNPMICWIGSGYEFDQIAVTKIRGTEVYTGVLKNGQDQLYTAWWYDNGVQQTISQWQWRLDAMRTGKNYAVVNVTSDSPTKLAREVIKALDDGVVRKALDVRPL